MKDSEDFASLLGEFEKEQAGIEREPQAGEKVRGTVVSIQGDSVFVDLGFKTEGIAEIEEFTDADGNLTVGIGDSIEIEVSGKDDASGTLLLGSQHVRHVRGSEGLRQAFKQQTPVEGRVTGVTKGGLEVEISGIRAFCPASQIDIQYIENLDNYIEEKLAFRITKFEGGRHPNLVVSRRVLLEEEQRMLAAQTRAQLEEGAIMKGSVSSIKDYGAFIDLGGIEGMVHISELSQGRVEHPKDILTLGQPVEVSVLKIEQTDNPKHPERISLSIRALEKDPWQDVVNQYPVGTQVQGKIIRLQPFGAFVELTPGVDGLVHISELGAGRRITHPQEVVNVGDQVTATVLSVDIDKRRIALSLDTQRKTEVKDKSAAVDQYKTSKKRYGTLGDLLKESLNKQKQ